LLFHQLNTALYKVVQRFACEHVVLQQCDVDKLFYGVVAGCIFGKDAFLLALCCGNLLFYLEQFVFLAL
jgi:hypothetical protein